MMITMANFFRVLAATAALARAAQGATYNVGTGASLQDALNAARPGDTIILEAGAQFSGNFLIPNKGTSSEWITIQSSAMSSLPPDGVRVTPQFASSMPKLISSLILTQYLLLQRVRITFVCRDWRSLQSQEFTTMH